MDDAEDQRSLARDKLLANPLGVNQLRETLGSLSAFMTHLKQPIAWRANREDQCTGHFFEGRFYSGALLDETAIIGTLAYVDLNPVRAKMVSRAVEADHTSVNRRLKELGADQKRLDHYLAPVISGLTSFNKQTPLCLPITLASYLDYLEQFSLNEEAPIDQEAAWYKRVAVFRRKQRAYGQKSHLESWAAKRGWSRLRLLTEALIKLVRSTYLR